MLFHTWTFLLFLAVVLPVLFALRNTRLWIPWLLIASYTFYGWWNPYYLILVFTRRCSISSSSRSWTTVRTSGKSSTGESG